MPPSGFKPSLGVAGPAAKAELPKPVEYGSEENFKEVLRLTGQTPDKDKYAEQTAANTARMANALERQNGGADNGGMDSNNDWMES